MGVVEAVRVGRALAHQTREALRSQARWGEFWNRTQTPGVWAEDGIAKMEARFDMVATNSPRFGRRPSAPPPKSFGHRLFTADWEDLEDEAIATALPTLVELREQGG